MRFIRKNGRVIPIREKGDRPGYGISGDQVSSGLTVATGAGIAALGATKAGIKGKTFRANTYGGDGFRLLTVSDRTRWVPKGFALLSNSGGRTSVAYASNFFNDDRKGWGKKLFSSVQFDAHQRGSKEIGGLVISNKALRFMGKESSTYSRKGRHFDYQTAKKLVGRGFGVTGTTKINLKNKSYLAFGLKKAWSPNRLMVGAGIAIALTGFMKRRSSHDR